jgi:prepilin-type N-terminal cleavage/methylation domain-containing protein
MNNKKQSGFTLVEIAIVLVVIGLLLGGILKGQQLINSARVRNLADQNSGVQAAYYGFVDRFRNLPGDIRVTQPMRLLTGIPVWQQDRYHQMPSRGRFCLVIWITMWTVL